VKYTEEEMLKIFEMPITEKEEVKEKKYLKQVLKFQDDEDLFQRIWSLDCEAALKNLSGTDAVAFDKYEFKDNRNGNLNIISNGKSTSCFIDRDKRIGSADAGGPTIWQWINWYQKDHKKTYQMIKQYLPGVIS
jgi:hypothetical protein